MKKRKSEIVKLELDDASYAGTGEFIEPTFVNFFFGGNGTGKSTIAKTIESGKGAIYRGSKTSDQYLVLVYNQEFIDQNLRSYRNMPGVFTLNSKNTDIQEDIDDLQEKSSSIKAEIDKINTCLSSKKHRIPELEKEFYKESWDKERILCNKFQKTQQGFGKSKPFMIEVLKHQPVEHDLEDIQILYDSAYSADAKSYQRFSEIEDIYCLDNLPDSNILQVSIVNSSDTQLAKLLRRIGSTEWAHEGHEHFSESAADVCPYCGQHLPIDFEETFLKSFDNQYQENLEKLEQFYNQYFNFSNRLMEMLVSKPSELYPKIKLESYTDKVNGAKAVIQENLSLIRLKIDDPRTTVTLKSTAGALQEISTLISSFNEMIEKNNAIITEKPKKRKECKDKLFELFAYQLRDDIDSYKKEQAALDNEISKLESEKQGLNADLQKIHDLLQELRAQTVETDTAKENINRILQSSGFTGFSLVPKDGVDHVYEVRRQNGSIADNLSEGEKNFIAFLYFHQLVHGSTNEDNDERAKIVVIDDPVSSMDSNNLFIVSSLIKEMIEVCRNNADDRNRKVPGNFIKQIFILTHNSYFHNDVADGYACQYEYVSFYKIQKFDEKSRIRLCVGNNPKAPSEKINISPVKNQYQLMWDELKEVKGSATLLNVMRRILEHYFLHILGYEGSSLKQAIMDNAKSDGKFKNPDGSDNLKDLMLASSLLSYLDSSSTGINDGLSFVEESLDVNECLRVFQIIFEVMDQKQHFDKMIRN